VDVTLFVLDAGNGYQGNGGPGIDTEMWVYVGYDSGIPLLIRKIKLELNLTAEGIDLAFN
jgi:hypothetical protein